MHLDDTTEAFHRAQLQAVLDALPVGVWIADADGLFLYRNQAGREIWGESAPMSSDRRDYGGDYRAWRIDGPRLSSEDWALSRALARGETTVEEELEIETAAGERKIILNSAFPVFDDDGSVVGGVAVNVDITERKRIQAQQELVNRRLRLLLRTANAFLAADDPRDLVAGLFRELSEQTGVGVYLHYVISERDGVPGLVLNSSHGIDEERIQEFRRVEVGDSISGLAAADRRRVLFESLGGREGDASVAALRAQGISAYVVFPLIAQGELVGTLSFGHHERPGFGTDELELLQAIADQVASATQQRLARRAAEEANAAKSAFMATVSHELRTPLNAIIGYTELLKEGIPRPLEADTRTTVERISYGARHLLQLIEEILSFSRLEAGREKLEIREVDIPELLEEVRAVAEPLAADKMLDFQIEAPDVPATLQTDPRKLRQILVNLLGNAVKFTERGLVSLTVSTDDEWVRFAVSDTGRGIGPEEQERLFEEFWQADPGTVAGGEGTGLGLTISRRLSDLLQGRLEVESDPGDGSTFTLWVPLREGDAG